MSILTMFSSIMYINIPMKIYFLLKKGVVFNLEPMLVKKASNLLYGVQKEFGRYQGRISS